MHSRRAPSQLYLLTPDSTPVKNGLVHSRSSSRDSIASDSPRPVRRRLAQKPARPPIPAYPPQDNTRLTRPVDTALDVIYTNSVHLYNYFWAVIHEKLLAPTLDLPTFRQSLPGIQLSNFKATILGPVITAAWRATVEFGPYASSKFANVATTMVLPVAEGMTFILTLVSYTGAMNLTGVKQLSLDGARECVTSAFLLLELMVLSVDLMRIALHALSRHLLYVCRQDPKHCILLVFATLAFVVVAVWSTLGSLATLFFAGYILLPRGLTVPNVWACWFAAVAHIKKHMASPSAVLLPASAPATNSNTTPFPGLFTSSTCTTPRASFPGRTCPPSPNSPRMPRYAARSPLANIPLPARSTKPSSTGSVQGLGRRIDELHRILAGCNEAQLESVSRLVAGMRAQARAKADSRKWRI